MFNAHFAKHTEFNSLFHHTFHALQIDRKMKDVTSGVEAFVRPFSSSQPYTEYDATQGLPSLSGKWNIRYIQDFALL